MPMTGRGADEAVGDAELVRRLRDGDERAADDLFARYHARLVSRMRRWTSDPATAEDLAQDTWARSIGALHRFDVDRPLWPWLRTVADNVARSELRRPATQQASRWVPLDDAATLPPEPDPCSRIDDLQLLGDAAAALPARQRRAFVETHVLGVPSATTAAAMGLDANGYRQLVHRARRNLRSSLAGRLALAPAALLRRSTTWLRGRVSDGGAGAVGASGMAQLCAVATLVGGVLAVGPTISPASPSADEAGAATGATAVVVGARTGQRSRTGVPDAAADAVGDPAAGLTSHGSTTPEPWLAYPPVDVPIADRRIGQEGAEQPDHRYGVHVSTPLGEMSVEYRVQDEEEAAVVDSAACTAVAAAPGGYCHVGSG